MTDEQQHHVRDLTDDQKQAVRDLGKFILTTYPANAPDNLTIATSAKGHFRLTLGDLRRLAAIPTD